MGTKDPFGYGHLFAGPLYHARRSFIKAHRLSWEIHNGRDLADDEFVLHTCDNPPCVNPAICT